MPVQAEARDDQRLELSGQEVGQVERAGLGVLQLGVRRGAGVELEAVRPTDPLHAIPNEDLVEGAARPAVGVRDEELRPGAVVGTSSLDPGSDGVGDALRTHVQGGVDANDLDPGQVAREGQELSRERAAADDQDARRITRRPGASRWFLDGPVRPHWRGARR